MMRKPNLFIVGAAKSGTTTLYKYLKKHSKVFMPEDELYKEPAFFSKKGERMGLNKYLSIFKNANEQHLYRGEASTAYLTDNISAQRIFTFNPNAKIIIILRNPVERAYSLYNWMIMEGYEYACSFKKALSLEKKRKYKTIPNFWEPEYYWNYMYLSSGLYYKQVKRYIDYFKDNVKVLIFEEMIKNIEGSLMEICQFLEIEFEKQEIGRENESRRVIFPLVAFFTRKISNLLFRAMEVYKNTNNKNDRDFLMKFVQLNKKPEKLNKEFKKQLLTYFLIDIENLKKLLGKDLSIWKKI